MSHSRITLAVLLALAAANSAQAGTRLFGESVLIKRDAFSDEILGSGPDIVLVATPGAAQESWKAAAKHLRAKYRAHLMQLTNESNAAAAEEAMDAYFVQRGLAPVTLVGGMIVSDLAAHHGDHVKKTLALSDVQLRQPDTTIAAGRIY